MSNPKQVIVMRRYFPDGKGGIKKVRLGKYIAQGAHASMGAILNLMHDDIHEENGGVCAARVLKMRPGSALHKWLKGSFAKICCYVDTEEELLELYNKAKEAGLPCSLITDSGRTEFGGVPTNTCIAIGPDYPNKIDPITGGLKLL